MALAADLLADPARQPVFFHCVAGHHRTSLAHAAYLIRHEGYTAEQAWRAIASLSWARPDSPVDRNDRFLIEEFARIQRSLSPPYGQGVWEVRHGSWSREAGQTTVAALGMALPLAYIGWNQLTFNFAIPQPGRLYRSGQMHPGILAHTLRKHGIRTVVNLRGPNHREAWYRDELAATLAAGATQVDIPLSSCVWMSRIQLKTLIQVLDTCEYPCASALLVGFGADRAGLGRVRAAASGT